MARQEDVAHFMGHRADRRRGIREVRRLQPDAVVARPGVVQAGGPPAPPSWTGSRSAWRDNSTTDLRTVFLGMGISTANSVIREDHRHVGNVSG
jgi:hypothetical protein